MKIASILIIVSLILGGCFVHKDTVQADLQDAQLIKIDTIYRYPAGEQVLTWRCADKMEYVTISPMNRVYSVGSRVVALVRK